MQENKHYTLFKNGSVWLKADFHLHTQADKEFTFNGEENSFINDYVAQLQEKSIRIGTITNHNKFDKNEFSALSKLARKNEILLLPGVELSVNDGANGIHVLVVFSSQWLEKGNDYISPFISSMFPGKAESEYQQENGRSDKNILQVVEELEKVNRDYFLVFAHVEQRSGLWEEMQGGKLSDFSHKRYTIVRERTLGFQKVRTHDDREKVKQWLSGWYPAEVEGSDAKAIDQIGSRQHETWLKVGDFTFEAIKYALADFSHRLSTNEPENQPHSFIANVTFEGGILDGKTIEFSPELNALIGIRGSGKSSVLEAVRYTLDIPFGEKTIDIEYKNKLIAHTLGSGGKVTIKARDRHQQEYIISRRLNDSPEVFVNGELQPGLAIRETIIHKPIYFGQKDLSSTGEGFEKDLVEKLVGEKLHDIRAQINLQNQTVWACCDNLLKLSHIDEKIAETRSKKQDAEFRLKIFVDNGIDEKLQQQSDFDTDQRKISKMISDIGDFDSDLEGLLAQHEDDLKNHALYKSKKNEKFFDEVFVEFNAFLSSIGRIKNERKSIAQLLQKLKNKKTDFLITKKDLSDQFAEVRRNLESNLKTQGKSLNLEEFPELQKRIETSSQLLNSLEKERQKEEDVKVELVKALSKLNGLWHQEYKLINDELKKVNESQDSLRIKGEYKGNKIEFLEKFKSVFKGSGIRKNSFSTLVSSYSDFTAVYNNMTEALLGMQSSTDVFKQYFLNNLKVLLTWQVPNEFSIEYRGKLLSHHSLGQRASALILFVLSQKENDLIMIDQPEDDLDNQTIYKDVITLIRELKPKVQFLFATHNANFPVLGDAEQIHACKYSDEAVSLTSGSIDTPEIQQEIVDIMEGGEDAFNKRKEIYQIWKPQN
jgi:ABC-type cobalamin/Fe3+-siderophores transport system ATPase subunit